MKLLLLIIQITQIIQIFAYNINIINTPFDKGANMHGSSFAYNILEPDLIKSNLIINKIDNVICENKHVTQIYSDVYMNSWNNLNQNKLSLQIGGDHSIAINSIFAANTYCGINREKLGVLWVDAHTDFNTIETSITGNLHGVPVAVLCGHTLHQLSFGDFLDSSQFAYYGARDIDTLEFDRIQDHNMLFVEKIDEIKKWMNNFDRIHISFDMDSLDPSVFSSVNTPVYNGLELEEVYMVFDEIKKSNKLLSVDLVEYNPLQSINNEIIIEILEKMLL